MCCQPDHIGPPPEWQYLADREGHGGDLPDRAGLPLTGARVGRGDLAALASILHDSHQRGSGPGRGPVSTEGGQGRAMPGHGNRPTERAELAGSTAVADTTPEPAWVQRPRR